MKPLWNGRAVLALFMAQDIMGWINIYWLDHSTFLAGDTWTKVGMINSLKHFFKEMKFN